jgi:hypothetical protein
MKDLILLHQTHKNREIRINRALIISIEFTETSARTYTTIKMVNGDHFTVVEAPEYVATAPPEP